MHVLVIPDLHVPWHHPGAWDFLADLIRAYKPRAFICLGDEVDAAAWSRFPKNPDLPSPGDELALTRRSLKPLMKLCPSLRICESNHTIRPWKRASEMGLPAAFLRPPGEVLDAPTGWKWAPSWTIDGVLYEHGEGRSGQSGHLKAAVANRKSTVIGHLHAHAGIYWLTGRHDRIFGMNAGCLIDPDAEAFSYGKHMANRPCLGAGLVLDGMPVWVPMP